MVMDPRIRSGIFAGESGGDYNALFGYRNRKPGAPQVTNMTVGQVLDFTGARGAGSYGQSVKDEIGRIATPVGAYQVVGKTLRDAVNTMGIDLNAKFDRETQDRIGQWILEQQGTGAWEGYKGPMDPEDFLNSFDGALSGGGTRSFASGDLPFLQEPELSTRDRVLGGLGNIGDILIAAGRGEAAPEILSGDRMMARQRAKQGRNQTAQALHAAGHTDLAQAVLGGQISGADALKHMYSLREASMEDNRTALQQNYEYALAQGMPPEEARKWVSSGNNISVNTGDGTSPLADVSNELMQNVLTARSSTSAQTEALIQDLEEGALQTGKVADITLPLNQIFGADTARAEDFKAYVSNEVLGKLDQIAGALSNKELDFVFSAGPQFKNSVGGNLMILKAQRLAAQQAAEFRQSILEWSKENVDPKGNYSPAAFQQFFYQQQQALNDKYTPEYRKIRELHSGGATTAEDVLDPEGEP